MTQTQDFKIIVKESMNKTRRLESEMKEVLTKVKSGVEQGRTKTGNSFIRLINTIVLF